MLCVVDELGKGAVRTMAIIKNALDPHNILNPGKLLHQVRHNSISAPFSHTRPQREARFTGFFSAHRDMLIRLLTGSILLFVSRSIGV